MHDFGKKGNIITTGHAATSKVYAEEILANYDLPQNIKDRIIKHVANHHWFERYNKQEISAQDVANIFGSKADITIAKIMAKADFEAISPTFHLERLCQGQTLTQKEFDKRFAELMDKIQ